MTSQRQTDARRKAARASVEARRRTADERRARLRRHALRALERQPLSRGALELIVIRGDDPQIAHAELAAIVSTLVRDGLAELSADYQTLTLTSAGKASA